ncbi:MAG: hypothetical protein LC104_12940 [Bacteroidales bacterium]|nr:hypothetical protein [Bacteroidales bacterium]
MRATVRGGLFVLTLIMGVPSLAVAASVSAPPDLPRYDLKIHVDTERHSVDFRMTVTWTNRHTRPTNKIVINFYPHYEIPANKRLLLAKTLEMLRLNPSHGIDPIGRHGTLQAINLVAVGGRAESPPRLLPYQYDPSNPTAISAQLPATIGQGQSVTIELIGGIQLVNKQGRWGHWDGVHFLTNALPVVAYYDRDGWHETPFVPWHQPFWNEAGVYSAAITLPARQVLACSAEFASESTAPDGQRTIVTKPFIGRDFALVCSHRFQEYRGTTQLPNGRTVQLRCCAFPEHQFYAEQMLRITGEAIPIYSRWFGDFPYDQFTICESFFGWNGNECSGIILIDERVFGMPHLAVGYVEYLVSHETCHQWWYNRVGTNGYSETFMDEGAATYFTHRLMDQKSGKNNELVDWPRYLEWLPNIRRENYRYASIQGAIRRGDAPPAAGDLPQFGHLVGLFSGAYDRGSKVFGMIENRLGEAAFLEFTQQIVRKYSFDVLTAADYKRELEEYTGQSWDSLFEQWVYGKGLTDWSVRSVTVTPRPRPMVRLSPDGPSPPGRRVEVVLQQSRELTEPTTVEFQFADGAPVRLPIGPLQETIRLAEYDAEIQPLTDGTVRVTATLPADPVQVQVDPDRVLLDADPSNNRWHNPPRFTLVPIYSMLNETDLTNDYDRWNFGAGPWIGGALYPDPWYTRSTMLGVRAGAYKTQEFSGGAYVAARSDYRDLVMGVDGLIDHWPGSRTQIGFNVERRLAGPVGDAAGADDTAFRAALFGRYVLEYSSSLYLPPMSYIDLYTTYQDNFLPMAKQTNPGGVRPDSTWLNGLHYRLNLYTPYWDPERGFWVDLAYAVGTADLGSEVGTHQLKGELATAHKLPVDHWYFSEVKVAGRAVAWGAFPDRGRFFALGGGTLFRGFDLAQRQGSFLWTVNTEIRWPVALDVRWDCLDHFVGLRNVYVASFYDVGAVYDNGRIVDNVAHAVGLGIRADMAVFSFLERAILRFDVGKTINAATPFQFWFGVQHAF